MATSTTDWTNPKSVSDIDLAFGGIDGLMPEMSAIPAEFKTSRGTKWNDVQRRWFFTGLSGATFAPKDGIDEKTALRHLATIQGSFAPKHEHKSAAVAYLMSLWFDDVVLP